MKRLYSRDPNVMRVRLDPDLGIAVDLRKKNNRWVVCAVEGTTRLSQQRIEEFEEFANADPEPQVFDRAA